ncbi:MAG: tRNA (adenosine(37)-N6)-threonylcarbamoyltransferase complex dimerization subunit type 1 TsaB [Candidatus Omnitrophica bacterium]|nr:tRNA (adenosine(37)-N6)-threonylcarbamoyltransferase complex dimerization subunit type 1 TsaB [Candidatus Omnitrophota bacterium]
MKVLGIDTSSKTLSVALGDAQDIITEESHLLDRRHSSMLVLKIKEMLKKSRFFLKDVDVFVVGLGPGSFTGLRIGVSTIKGFGIATKKPCIGISSIDGLALNVDEENKTIVPIIDAKRQQVYSAIYKKENGLVVRKSDYLLLNVDRLMRKVKGPCVFLGDGIPLYKDRIRHFNKTATFLEEEYWYPRAGNLIKLALRNRKGLKNTNLARLRPIYLYPKDCQVRKN